MISKAGTTVTVLFLVTLIIISTSFALAPVTPDKKDKCPVCGMKVSLYPKWIAQIIFSDGSYALFDGPKDMMKYYLNMSRFEKHRTRNDISDIYVTEYYTTKPVKAQNVYFITGSDVYGPMGSELVPVQGDHASRTFMKDHNGKNMLRFSAITPHDIPAMKSNTQHQRGPAMKGMPENQRY